MISMNYIGRPRLKLAARNEGKIKSFESCVDVRAWSHDIRNRDRYLRDWMKRDMPICVLPVCTLASVLTIMNSRSHGRVTTRCHPSCNSKLLLECIRSSCSIMNGCLRNNKDFERYFREEELETIYWPCERCLEILKSIKLFWKIIIEKVLKINLPKTNEFKSVNTSIHNVAREWRKHIVQDAKYVKSATILYTQNENELKKSKSSIAQKFKINDINTRTRKDFLNNKSTETGYGIRSVAIQKDSARTKISKCTSFTVKTADIGIDAPGEKGKGDTSKYNNNMENLEPRFKLQNRFEKENIAFKMDLQHVCQNGLKDSSLFNPNYLATVDNFLKNQSKEDFDLAKDIDSEMIITLKSCKNETFKHVSMLQVIHKTNGPMINLKKTVSCCRNEDPLDILCAVHKTFGEIVNREMAIANNSKSSNNKDVKIKATFCNVGVSKSAPSCNSLHSDSFESVQDRCDIPK